MSITIFHDIVVNSLIIFRKQILNGKIKTCRLHDLIHDLCLREAETKKILYAVNDITYEGPGRDFPRGLKLVSFQITRS